MGFVSNSNGFEYRFGFLFEKSKGFKKLKDISLQKFDFEELLNKSPKISFKGLFGDKEYDFEIRKREKSLVFDLTVNGDEGIHLLCLYFHFFLDFHIVFVDRNVLCIGRE